MLRRVRAFGLLALLGCGGESVQHEGSGGTGGTTGGTGGTGGTQPPVNDCAEPVALNLPCATPGAHCRGPCVNSWQADYACADGTWRHDGVESCGPDAAHAPTCRNAFLGGELTPCCPEGGLECAGKPNQYPGYTCTPNDGSFCSCSCFDGQPVCGC